MNKNNAEIFLLNQEDVPNIVDVLCDSFANYPVMRFILNSETNYDHRLKVLIHFFVMARIFREEVIFGIGDRANLMGVALTSNPGNSMIIPKLKNLRDKVWLELGPGPNARYEKFSKTCAQFEVDQPHLHLNMIGVRTDAQGKGFAGKLMDYLARAGQMASENGNTWMDPKAICECLPWGYS